MLIPEIIPTKDLFVSGKFYSWKPECVLESKRGQIVISIPEEFSSGLRLALLHVRKEAGNGKFAVDHTAIGLQEFTASSKGSSESFLILTKSQNMEIFRPKQGIGEITVLGLQFFDLNLSDFSLSDHSENVQLKALFKQLPGFSGLRFHNGKVYASNGATIEDSGLLNEVISVPPNVFSRQGDFWKCSQAAQVIDLIRVPKAPEPPVRTPMFVHREVEAPRVTLPAFQVDFSKVPVAATNKTLKTIASNGQKYLLLRRGGKFTYPCSIEPGANYSIFIEGKNLNGNGRIHCILESKIGNSLFSQPILLDRSISSREIRFSSTRFAELPAKLSIAMNDDGIGEVLLSSVRVVPTPIASESFVFASSGTQLSISAENKPNWQKELERRTRDAAIFTSEQASTLCKYLFPVNSNIHATTFEGKQWRAWNAVSFLKVITSGVYSDLLRKNGKCDLILTSLETLEIGERIYLNAYSGSLNDEYILLLNSCSVIYTPSLKNYLELRSKLSENVKVERKVLPWLPVFDEKVKDKKYDVCLAPSMRDFSSWKAIPENWKTVMLGGNTNISVSDYVSYDDWIRTMMQSRVYLEFNDEDNTVLSPGLEMALQLGLPAVTNLSAYFMTENVFSAIHLSKIPEMLLTAWPSVKERKIQPLEEWGNKLAELFGKGEDRA